jgi:hypothetical protein
MDSMSRSLERLWENWEILPKNDVGEVIRKTFDYDTRRGQCLPPSTVRELFPFTVMHKVCCILY